MSACGASGTVVMVTFMLHRRALPRAGIRQSLPRELPVRRVGVRRREPAISILVPSPQSSDPRYRAAGGGDTPFVVTLPKSPYWGG